jgi:hypothetical protein
MIDDPVLRRVSEKMGNQKQTDFASTIRSIYITQTILGSRGYELTNAI